MAGAGVEIGSAEVITNECVRSDTRLKWRLWKLELTAERMGLA